MEDEISVNDLVEEVQGGRSEDTDVGDTDDDADSGDDDSIENQ